MNKKPKTAKTTRPSAGIRVWYKRKLQSLVRKMHNSIMWWISARYKSAGVAMDASPAAEMQKEIDDLRRYWESSFSESSIKISRAFAEKTLKYTDYGFKSALKEAGMTVELQMTKAMRQAYEGVINTQVGLIKSIPSRYLDDVQTLVMESVQRGRDLNFLAKNLHEKYGVTKNRAALIARDQNNKASSTIYVARNLEVGITEGVWNHSRAGKKPRPSHVSADKKVFDLKKGMFLDEKWVLPGQEINCRCHWTPVLPKYMQG